MKQLYRSLRGCFYRTFFVRDDRCFIINLVLVGFTIRLIAALCTYGTEDVQSWEIVGETLLQGQNPYKYTHFLRWPPLWMVTIFVVKHLSLSLHLDFATLIKIPPIIADVVIAVVIYYCFVNKYSAIDKGRLGAMLYAVNPVSILVVAVHGQFGSIAVLFLLSSLYFMWDYKKDTDLFIAAIFLSLAIFSKTWPLLLLPLFVAHIPTRKAQASFVTISLLPFLVSVSTLFVLTPSHIYYKLLRYSGLTGWWGFISFYSVVPNPVTKFIADFYSSFGTYLLALALGAMSLYYYKRQRVQGLDLLEAIVSGILLLYFLSPGFGIQYLMWIVPFTIIYTHQNKFARHYFILASLILVIQYVFRPYNGTLGEWVLQSHQLRSARFYASYASRTDIAITNLLQWPLWLYCGLFLTLILKRWHRLSTVADSPVTNRLTLDV